jgi:hypothetical protein
LYAKRGKKDLKKKIRKKKKIEYTWTVVISKYWGGNIVDGICFFSSDIRLEKGVAEYVITHWPLPW